MRAITLALLCMAAPLAGQDTLRLAEVHEAAVGRDPRVAQGGLHEAASGLRMRNLAVERLPQLTVGSRGSYQSEVAGIPVQLPGVNVPQPPKERYEVSLEVQQSLYDGGVVGRRREIERARLAAERAGIDAALYPLRVEANEAFFTALLLQERLEALATLSDDLEARLGLLRTQVRAGAALPGDTAVLRAELLKVGQQGREVVGSRRAALAVLGELRGRAVPEATVLALPDLAAAVAAVRGDAAAAPRAHPQYAAFTAQRESLARQGALIEAQTRPQLVAVGQLAYGQPGQKQFTDEPHGYWTTGVQLRWSPWSWGSTARDREALSLQQQVVATEEAAFTARLRRQVQDELAAMDRLEATLEEDARIIALREQVERQARAQLAERAITPAAYVDVRTDLQEARLDRQRHRVELARARAQYLTTLGIAPR